MISKPYSNSPVNRMSFADASVNSPALKIYRIQYLRAIAALSVVICHASYYVMAFRGDKRMWDIFAEAGAFGVLLFFSISGYLMAHLAQSTPAWRFLAHRLLRIYPPYWICVAAVILVTELCGAPSSLDPIALILAPGATTSFVLGVEWTLPFELTYYAIIFAIIAIGLREQLPKLALLWVIAIIMFDWLRPDMQHGQFPTLLQLPISVYSLAFAGGLLVPSVVKYRWIGPSTPILAIALIAISFILPGAGLSFGAICFSSVLLVASAVRLQDVDARAPNRSLVALGDWSYALYLCHVPIIILMCKTMTYLPIMQLWIGAIAAPIVVAIGFGKLDVSIYRTLKRLADGAANKICIFLGVVFLVVFLGASITPYIRQMEFSKASADSAELGKQLAEKMRSSHALLGAVAQSLGKHPDTALHGHFDHFTQLLHNSFLVQGWAASNDGGTVKVLLFSCGHYMGALPLIDRRPDVAAALHLAKGDYGFLSVLTLDSACSSGIEALLLSNDGGYAVISSSISSIKN